MYRINKLKKVLGDKLREHMVLRNFTSTKIGGVADYYFCAKKIEDLIGAVISAREDQVPFFILGGGSNILISDYGYPGLVIHNQTNNISFVDERAQAIADSGVNLSRLILEAVNHELGGLESLYGIYGTLGGAIYSNVGAYGVEIFDFIKSVTLLAPNNKLVNKDAVWFDSKYRSTKLKEAKNKEYIILTAKLQLSHNKKEQLLEQITKIKRDRDKRFLGLGASCGSIFRNPSSGKSYKNIELAKKNSAGYLLDKIGAKKIRIGDAGIYSAHANIFENKGRAKAIDTRKLIEELRNKVRENSGVELKEEIEYVGQWE